ncbi:MBL fold metallo-hydrolase [Hyalangium sp.]|uniref:MBL fold metallo-hydrolase n=1 Tax=Hyalangium sp. TaxID=2028555 RepID=UPI002D3DF5A7|nr:MBL fold metallo-hydrolase [Hyalangium sp.]HYH98670.1 MBL fold metallo-hydrolase [Hyalangium sp.]
MPRSALVLLLALVAGCASQRPAGARVTLTSHEDSRVGTYVSSPWGFSTSSYWIEGPEGLILIDTQFLPSAAEEFVSWAEQVTGKKALLAIVLHPNPDKFNGTDVLRKRGIRVVTSEQVRELIPSVHQSRTRKFYDRYKPDYPTEVPLPDSFGSATTELSAGGVTVKAHVMGAGCSEAHVVVEYEGHLFPGDMIANNAHSWLEIGKTDQWLQRIDEMKALKPKWVHPGRGPSGNAGLLDMERAYLERVITEVAAEKPQGKPTDEALERIQSRVMAAYPGLRLDVFLAIGLPAEWERQAQAAGSAR